MRFTVVTVVYNGAETIEQTINSVLSQTYPDIEYIIVDGGSTDGTVDIIRKYESQLSRFISERDNGIYDAMNKGIGYATGDVISFLNGDDWYAQGIFEKLNEIFSMNSAIDIVSACPINVYEDKIVPEMYWEKDASQMYYKILYSHPATFQRLRLFETVGMYNPKYKLAADIDWYVRAHRSGAIFEDVSLWTTYFRKNGASAFQLQRVYEEFRDSVLSYINEIKDEQFKNTIILKLEEQIENAKYQDYFLKYWKERLHVYKRILSAKEKYHIWGCGLHGERCLQLCKALELDVISFIESQPRHKDVEGVVVKGPDEIMVGAKIIIASARFENDIREMLDRMRFNKADIISFLDLEKMMIDSI